MARENNEHLTNISNLLNELTEVTSYIVIDIEGKVHLTSSQDYDENTINSCIFLWVTGTQLGGDFHIGAPVNLIYKLKEKKIFIQKYENYLLILYLAEGVKFSTFKKKIYDLLQ